MWWYMYTCFVYKSFASLIPQLGQANNGKVVNITEFKTELE